MTDPGEQRRPMSPERWQRVAAILTAAIDCAVGDRPRLLAQQCASDATLRQDVEALLAAHDDEGGALDRLADAVAPAAALARIQPVGWRGSRVGQYLVLDLLGEGGMGLVYKARDERLERDVALKFLPPHLSAQPAAKQRFLIEARAAAALDHPNLCTIHEIGETDEGHLFLAMPLYEGETLEVRLRRGRLSFDESASITLQVAEGLARAHQRGIVHRDVKPSNVMLLADGMVKVLDFGIATRDGLTSDGARAGTVAYMSPEQVRGDQADCRADVWALGIVLHEMLTGVRPFDAGDPQHVIAAILSDEPTIVATSHPDVPADVDVILRRALARSPDRRYPSMPAFAADVAALASRARGASDEALRQGAVLAAQSQPPPAGERRRAAVLVSIVSEYGVLVEQLDPAATHRLVAQVRDLAVEAVRRHGGIVNQAIGEEIVSVFGVPTAHEDDELRAVRAALELHARVRALPVDTDEPATVRIQSGLHAGPLVVQRLNEGPRRYTLVGAAAHAAARLAAHADADDLLLSPECRRLVAPFVHTAACPPVLLEPDTDPITPFRVTGETGLETRLEASQREGLTPYVGREPDLTRLVSYVERARQGHGSVIAVVGEAGSGKSRLLYELRGRVGTTRGIRLLAARCRAYGDVEPFFPFVEMLRAVVGARDLPAGDSDAIVTCIRAIDDSLEPFVPLYLHLLSAPSESHALPRHLQGEHLQAALLDALSAIVTAMARRATLVVLLEDWHWADAASSAALRRMAEIVTTCGLLFVVSTRPERGLLEAWPDDMRLSLEPLDFGASVAIMRSVLRVGRVSEQLAQRVFERTGGNPFFIEQVCLALLEQGAVTAQDGEAVVDGGASALSLPDTVQAVIRTRLDNLDAGARDLLRVAAVIGRDFAHSLVAEALGERLDFMPTLATLKTAGLIQESSVDGGGNYRFTHALAQEVSYESLLSHQRKELHDIIGRAIERQHADHLDERSALLAYHFDRAAAWPEAVRYGMRAAERASALSQFADALAMLDRVLEWLGRLPDDEGRHVIKADVLLRQERACETLGLRGRQRTIIAALIAHLSPGGPSPRLAHAYLRQGDLLTLLKRFEAADRALSTALRVSREQGDTTLERHTLRSIGLLRWHEGRHADALAITEDALAIDREHHDLLSVAGDLTNLGNILKSMGQYPEARATLEEALAMPPLAEDPRKMVVALHNLANVHRAMDDPEAALLCLRRADQISRTHLLPIQRSFHLTSIAHIDLQQGRIDSALRTYREAIALSRSARHAEGLAQSLRTLGEVLFALGLHDEALPYLDEAALLFGQLEDPAAEAEMWSRSATILTAARRSSEARDAWERARLLRLRLGDMHGQLDALEGLAHAIRQESPEASIPAFEVALSLASALAERPRALSLRNTLGILEWTRSRYTEALAHYEAALLLARALDDRRHEGLILNSIGVTLTRLHRPEEARTVLEQSLELTRDTGQKRLEADALAALGRLWRAGVRPEPAADAAPGDPFVEGRSRSTSWS